MKWLVAVVRPNRLEVVKDALGKAGFHGFTVTDVQGVGRQRGHSEVYRGHEYTIDLLPKVKIEAAVPTGEVDRFVETVEAAARSGAEGQIGDGKIFMLGLEEAVRIRTGEKGDDAL